MEHQAGESDGGALRVDFDRRLNLEFYRSRITSDAGLLAYRELDDALGLADLAGAALSECRRGKNTRHLLAGLFRQSVFGRLAGYEDVNDADRLAHDPAMRAVVYRGGLDRRAASTSQMGRFETAWLTSEANVAALADLSGAWIDQVHARRPQTTIVLDMDSSVSETHGAQEGSAYNGHFACMCHHPLFVFSQFGDLERCALRPGNVHSGDGWREVLAPVVARYRNRNGSGGAPDPGRNGEQDFHGRKRSNDTHASTTDPDARLYRKGHGKEAKLCFMGHALMQNRNGLIVGAVATHAPGHAERLAAQHLVELHADTAQHITVGGDKGFDTQDFVAEMRATNVTPHVAQNDSGRRSAIDGRTTRHPGYAVSLRIRKRIEEAFGWAKTVAGLRKACHRGLPKIDWQFTFAMAAYNLA